MRRIREAGISRRRKRALFFFLSFFFPTRYIRLSMISFRDTCLVRDRANFRPGGPPGSAHSRRNLIDAPPGRVITLLRRYATYCNEVAPMREMPRSMHQRTLGAASTRQRRSGGLTSPVQGYLLCARTYHLRANLYDVTDVFPSAIPSPRAILSHFATIEINIYYRSIHTA